MRDKIIETILDSKDEFISGEELSKKLGISVKSVDNAIQRIRRKIKVIWSIPPKNL